MPPAVRDAALPQAADTAEMPRWILQMRDVVTIIGFVGGLMVLVFYRLNLQLSPPAQLLYIIIIIIVVLTAACLIFFGAVVFWGIRKSQLRGSLAGRLVLTGMVCFFLSSPFILAAVVAVLVLFPFGSLPSGVVIPMELILVGVFFAPLGMCIAKVGGVIRIVEIIRYLLAEHGN